MSASFLIFPLLAGLLATSGCAHRACRFADAPLVERLGDDRPSPVPHAWDFDLEEYYVRSLARHPVREAFTFVPSAPSGDVNAWDQVPASSWYTPRLGYREISPDELLRGPFRLGPPEPPLTVVKAKSGGGNPGFIAADARGVRYLLKFDPPEFPAIETTTALVVNRLFWGFGYNVPEDYLFFFRPDELQVDPKSGLTREAVDQILAQVAPPVEGRYRATASRFLEGIILGPIPERGVRPDDPNDFIPHEDRRVLRALRVFCAFTNHSDIRPDNTLDVYVGPPGKGHVVHYLLDFGEAFGGHGAEHDRLWDGHEQMFSFSRFARNLLTLGLIVDPWEHLEYTPWPFVGAFEGDLFSPEGWKPTYAYLPISKSQPEDEYWAAKIVGALTRSQIEALVEAAQYPDPKAAEYVVETLMKRRRKVVEHFLYQVSPVEAMAWEGQVLALRDMGLFLLEGGERDVCQVRFYDGEDREIAPLIRLTVDRPDFEVSIPDDLLEKAKGYLRVEIRLSREGAPLPPPARFHFRRRRDGTRILAGVEH